MVYLHMFVKIGVNSIKLMLMMIKKELKGKKLFKKLNINMGFGILL